MERDELMDKLEEIQNKNYNFFKGVNEADLATREDIADLFGQLLKERSKGNTVSTGERQSNIPDVSGSIFKGDCDKNIHWYVGCYSNGQWIYNECSYCKKRQIV